MCIKQINESVYKAGVEEVRQRKVTSAWKVEERYVTHITQNKMNDGLRGGVRNIDCTYLPYR